MDQSEKSRFQELLELRAHYETLLNTNLGWTRSPKESFNRWLFERSARPSVAGASSTVDPLLLGIKTPEISPVMKREIMEDLPVKISPPIKFISDIKTARQHLSIFISSSLSLLSRLKANPLSAPELWSDEEKCAEKLRELESWQKARAPSDFTLATTLSKIHEVRQAVCPFLAHVAEPVVNAICISMGEAMQQAAHKVQLGSQIGATSFEGSKSDGKLSPANPQQGAQAPKDDSDAVVTRDGGEHAHTLMLVHLDCQVQITKARLASLQTLFSSLAPADQHTAFLLHVWRMILRYQAVFGPGRFEGGGLHAAIPSAVFQCLQDRLGVTVECFASPLNATLSQYCSMFPDTDAVFGSKGSFFDFEPTEGSFEANPPFVEEILVLMIERMAMLLDKASGPMSFCVFLASWTDTPAWPLLQHSPFMRREISLPAREHVYVSGHQHLNPAVFDAVHSSTVFVLQNDAGAALWPASVAFERDLREAFSRPVTETPHHERDSVPARHETKWRGSGRAGASQSCGSASSRKRTYSDA